jgi:hypothetical protein
LFTLGSFLKLQKYSKLWATLSVVMAT